MKRVEQKNDKKADCGIACVAMVTRSSYSKVKKLLSKVERKGKFYTRHIDLTKAIQELGGYSVQLKKFSGYEHIPGIAIVACNKRDDGRWHWVAFNGNASRLYIYDPKPEKKGKITDFRGLAGVGMYLLISKDNESSL